MTGVTDEDRELAFANIKKAATYYGVEMTERSWKELDVHPQQRRKERARKAAATRRKRSGVTRKKQ